MSGAAHASRACYNRTVSRRPALPDPAHVVSGRARVTIEQLFALIAEVNPTDRNLPPRQATERYALKAKLQACLIHHHAEVIEVVADEREGVVSLRHRFADRDACHAVVNELDDAARRWVETELALGAHPKIAVGSDKSGGGRQGASPSGSRTGLRADDALSVGLRAMEEYDYDVAREQLTLAFRQSGGGVQAASALLDLLVNHLADDPAGLALESGLSALAAKDETVRSAMALAAAREGDDARAVRWLKGIEGTRATDTLVVLFEQAIRAADVGRATERLAAIRQNDAAHPSLPRLSAEWDRLRRDARAPLEAALHSVLTAEDWDAVEEQAGAILLRWPDSTVARDAKRKVELARHKDKIGRFVARLQAARNATDGPHLLALVRAGRALAQGNASLGEMLTECERHAATLLESENIRQIRADFAEGRLAAGLKRWTELSTLAQSEVVASNAPRELGWLIELQVAGAGVDAAMAMRAANLAFESNNLTLAAAALEPHQRSIRATASGRDLCARVDAARRHLAVAVAAGAAQSAEAAFSEGNLDAAESAARGLPSGPEFDALRARIAAARSHEDRVAALNRAQATGDFESCEALAEGLGGNFRANFWAFRDQTFRPRRFADVTGCLRAFLVDNRSPTSRTWLSPNGEKLVLVRSFARRVVVVSCDVASMAPTEAWTFSVPDPIQIASWTVEDDSVTIIACEVAVLKVSMRDGRVLQWRPPTGLDEGVQVPTLAPGGRYVWGVLQTGEYEGEARVYDIARWPSRHTIRPGGIPQPMWGSGEHVVGLCGFEKGITLFQPNGRPARGPKGWVPDSRATRFATNGSGLPLTATVDMSEKAAELRRKQDPERQASVSATPLGVAYREGREEEVKVGTYPVSSTQMPHMLAPATLEGRTYALMVGGGQATVMWFEHGGIKTDQLDAGTRSFPSNAVLVHDIAGRRALVLHYTRDSLHLAPAESVPAGLRPCLRDDHHDSVVPMDGFDFDLGCSAEHNFVTANARSLAMGLQAMDESKRKAWTLAYSANHADNPEALLDLAGAQMVGGQIKASEALFSEIVEQFPDHAQARLADSWGFARNGDWDQVWRLLNAVDFDKLPANSLQHALHLCGIAGLRTGYWDIGVGHLRRSGAMPSPACHVRTVVAMLDALDGSPAPEDVVDDATYVSAQTGGVVRRILAADRCLEAGDSAGAIAALDHALMWRAEELQSAARLAAAYLESPVESFAKWLALAALGGIRHALSGGDAHDLPLGERTWEKYRLDELERRAGEWLDSVGTAS